MAPLRHKWDSSFDVKKPPDEVEFGALDFDLLQERGWKSPVGRLQRHGEFVCPRAPNTFKKVLWGVFRGLNTFLEGIWSPRVVEKVFFFWWGGALLIGHLFAECPTFFLGSRGS